MTDLKTLLVAFVNYLITKGFEIVPSAEYSKGYFGDKPSKNITDYNSHKLADGKSIMIWHELKGKTIHYLAHLKFKGLLLQVNLYETFDIVFNVAIKGDKKAVNALLQNVKKFNGIESDTNTPDVEFKTFQRIKANKTGSTNNQITTRATKAPDTNGLGVELTNILNYLIAGKPGNVVADNINALADKATKSKAKTTPAPALVAVK